MGGILSGAKQNDFGNRLLCSLFAKCRFVSICCLIWFLPQLQDNTEAFAHAFLGPANAGNLRGASASGAAATGEGEGGHDDHPTGKVNIAEE